MFALACAHYNISCFCRHRGSSPQVRNREAPWQEALRILRFLRRTDLWTITQLRGTLPPRNGWDKIQREDYHFCTLLATKLPVTCARPRRSSIAFTVAAVGEIGKRSFIVDDAWTPRSIMTFSTLTSTTRCTTPVICATATREWAHFSCCGTVPSVLRMGGLMLVSSVA